jgi:heterodisulfide reductase subunit D
MKDIQQIITDTGAYSCLDCGKCTVVCPVSRYDSSFSPRRIVDNAILNDNGNRMNYEQVWDCITCSMCEERCQSGVKYTELIRSLRENARGAGCNGECTHGGALQSFMRLMTTDNLQQNRLDWVGKTLKTSEKGEVLYWVGCQPYFDVIFSDLGIKTLDTAKGAIKLLNSVDISPVLLPNERCCGHDLLWAGDIAGFTALAERNISEIQKSGVKKIVTTCPEGYLTLKYEYPRYFGEFDFEVVHITELLAGAIAEDKIHFKPLKSKVTYHDPCRLGRLGGVFEAPRMIINAIPDIEFIEMPRNRKNSLCCGTQAWINCGSVNKQIQEERLREADNTGADILLTSCPKCMIHFQCALHDDRLGSELDIELDDIVTLAAKLVQV